MSDKAEAWIFFAEKDIISAETLIANAKLTGEVAFHCQQAIEKYIKAYLSEHNVPIKKIHDLIKLYNMAKTIKDLNIDEFLLAEISKIYTESRYPENIGIKPDGMLPSMDEAIEYLQFAKKIESIVKAETGTAH